MQSTRNAAEVSVDPDLRPAALKLMRLLYAFVAFSFLGAMFARANLMSVLWAIFMYVAGFGTLVLYFTRRTGMMMSDFIKAVDSIDGVRKLRRGKIDLEEMTKTATPARLWPYAQQFTLIGDMPFRYELGRDAAPRFIYPGERLTLDTFPQELGRVELMVVTDDGKHVLVPTNRLKLLEGQWKQN